MEMLEIREIEATNEPEISLLQTDRNCSRISQFANNLFSSPLSPPHPRIPFSACFHR
jgi:hypothetical protein